MYRLYYALSTRWFCTGSLKPKANGECASFLRSQCAKGSRHPKKPRGESMLNREASFDLVPADASFVRVLLNRFLPVERAWVTYRLPFQRRPKITYPPSMSQLMAEHHREMLHHRAYANWWAMRWAPFVTPLLWVFPLPHFLSGRWFYLRHAYLADLRAYLCDVDAVVSRMWRQERRPWPPTLMRRWFCERQLEWINERNSNLRRT